MGVDRTVLKLILASLPIALATLGSGRGTSAVEVRQETRTIVVPAEPGALARAFDQVEQLFAADDAPGPVDLVLEPGTHALSEPLRFGPRVAATADAPVRVRSRDGARARVLGSVELEPSRFTAVVDGAERARLAPSVVDDVRVATIHEDAVHARLAGRVHQSIRVDDTRCEPSTFPNEGFASLDRDAIVPEVSPPAVPPGKAAYGVRAGHAPYLEEGRPQGWLGSLDEPRGAHVSFRAHESRMAGTWQQWEDELARHRGRVEIDGFLEANWLQRRQPIVAASSATRSIHLSRALAYGWQWRQDDKPMRIIGLLCELDAPGEWHYDPTSRRLFVLPVAEDGLESVEIPVAQGLFLLEGCRHVALENLDLSGAAGGSVVELRGARSCLVAGLRITNSNACGVRVGGTDNLVRSCDLIDLDQHAVIDGGRRSPEQIVSGGNALENCHVYQRHAQGSRVGVAIRGVGNAMRHCLIHSSLGQAVTVNGNDHVLEYNELFDIGYREGDGGAIYSGGDLTGYGIVYRANFFHHLMHVPGKVERSGIHLDDLQAGSTCVGNVFYKSAGKGIFMNGGAGHVIESNVFLDGFRGVYNVGAGSKKNHDRQVAILADPAHPHANTKENYVGRAERIVGPRGWESEPWSSRYPLMRDVLSREGEDGRMWPILCEVRDNFFGGNTRGDRTIWSRVSEAARATSTISGDRVVEHADFVDVACLDLRFAEGFEDPPPIEFERIGLQLDGYRRSVPDPRAYRSALVEFFDGVPCMPGTTERLDTGRLIEQVPRIGSEGE